VYTLVYQTLLHVSVPYNAGKDAIVALWDQQAEPFDAEKYMYMATKGPVAFLFVVMTSNLFIYLFFCDRQAIYLMEPHYTPLLIAYLNPRQVAISE